VKKTVEV